MTPTEPGTENELRTALIARSALALDRRPLVRTLYANLVQAFEVVDALRAVLAHQFDHPWEWIGPDEERQADGRPLMACRFCGHDSWDEAHEPDCVVLRRDELLGR